jgi:hypothetical protein
MPVLTRQTIPVSEQTLSLGSNLVFALPRESLIEGIDLVLEGTVSTVATTPPVEGLPALCKSLTLRGSIAGGATVEPLVSITGPDLFEIGQFHRGSLPPLIGGLNATGFFRLTLPIDFRENFFSTEIKSLMTALPAYAMSDLTLSVQIASQSELGGGLVLGGTPKAYVNVRQFYRNTIPDGIPFIRSLYEVLEDNNIVTNPTREIKLPSGGAYSLLLLRSFSGANAKQANNGTAPITNAPSVASGITIYDLSRFIKQQTDFLTERARNLAYVLDNLVDGNVCFVWNRGENNLFQTGQLGRALNNVLIQYNATAAAGSKVRFVWRRILDDTNALGVAP